MSFIGKNIKKIRTLKKLNQSEFAKIFDLNRGNISAYEEERAEPKINTIIQIANTFGVSVDLLITNELTANELYSLNIVNKKLNEAHHFSSKPQKKSSKSGIGLVYIKSYFEYIANKSNKDFIHNLPQIDLPVTFKGVSRAFELNGSEMEYNQQGLHHGDIMLGLLCDAKTQLELRKVYVIVIDEGIIVKRLRSLEKNQLTFESDDPNYDPIVLETKSVNELWEVKGNYSTYINPPKMLEEKVMLMEKRLDELESRL